VTRRKKAWRCSLSTLNRRRGQSRAFDALAELPWTRATGRRDELGLIEDRRSELVALLVRIGPSWGEGLADLAAHGLPPTPDGWDRFLDARRAEVIPELPARLHGRTAASFGAAHSKATLTEAKRSALEETEATHDGTVRLRPPAGLKARTRYGDIYLTAVVRVLGEVAIPERAFMTAFGSRGSDLRWFIAPFWAHFRG
jgi:hypothetical protein